MTCALPPQTVYILPCHVVWIEPERKNLQTTVGTVELQTFFFSLNVFLDSLPKKTVFRFT